MKPAEKRQDIESEKENVDSVAPKVEEPAVEAQDTIVEQPELETPLEEVIKKAEPVEQKEIEVPAEVVPEPELVAEPTTTQENVTNATLEAPVEAPAPVTIKEDPIVESETEATTIEESQLEAEVNTNGAKETSKVHAKESIEDITEPIVQPAADNETDAVELDSSNPKAEVSDVHEVPEPTEAPVQVGEDVPDPTKGVVVSELTSQSIDETPAKDSLATLEPTAPAEEPITQAKSDTVDIDFANQLS